ncbi:inositol hexakisphosphate kinase 3 [Latimeria chalumnae]|uniref:Kinase n=1 Tax=Latimeria chalumnae TaxID=7897 RepID=H3B9U4_LATCH|nr:PREDICTED: inositol hexakisphosphate kinase 3 [Latimeria chalumnae]XP_005995527.1 PREDICTED: inositol hexakisphosphate kinase 3 [Latimeria chalumnae]XP_014343615.1 PREDICTED: inositol hexakisphosphate kinase 3 [Latimeria chalumnae]XP_014343616.1 PREDICTED: inositol hexakisphosphate kinase 3 [Latimeria chalumnae]XP_014343617.1 PREDICTED: inositol hexakisphosphate kinase 3 [Latimeria chalumnae]XP_014343618.1 PREDICTED: inositol hexakisphosphate kinase 3 [Latimeria chalumnae]XP_014343619.1 PR|eukprot:XP_005995525.1 PREDICTED: inositol hexakisphosphate kinase 3 [Latimeria chalumnae]
MVFLEAMDLGDAGTRVLLEPFVHQVGGHTSMMRYDEMTICKPLISQEQWFYESLPPEMKQFTPQYKGIISVYLEEDSSGHLSLVACPQDKHYAGRENLLSTESPGLTSKRKHKRVKTSGIDLRANGRGNPQLDKALNESFQGKALRKELCILPDSAFQAEDANENQSERKGYNPWGLQCHRAQLTRMCSEGKENKFYRFLLLENVVSQFKYPCVLDLKMGTRQHGDDASEEKKERHMKKCAQSTSASLGVRVCGMQVYQSDSGSFLCRNKYYGRKLTAEGFRQTLYQFLHNGDRLQTDLLDPVILRLRALKLVIEQQSTYRFYSSSLLIIYDGKEASFPQGHFQKNAAADGFLPPPPVFNVSPQIDIRMIDFAHTTYKGAKSYHTTNDGPDQGYILGLDNLIKILKTIKAGEC